jgi:DsbC/DsbD-like thiol-disulfide interchange protein
LDVAKHWGQPACFGLQPLTISHQPLAISHGALRPLAISHDGCYNECVKLIFTVLLSATVLAQATPSLQFRGDAPGSKHAAIVAAPVEGATPGKVTLFLDVTPKPGIHVYAPGSKDYIPISVKLDQAAGIKPGKLTYPKSEMMTFGDEKVPVFQKAFRLTQEITLDKSVAASGTLTVAGTVHLQACDDRVCFPPENVPVKWTVGVK